MVSDIRVQRAASSIFTGLKLLQILTNLLYDQLPVSLIVQLVKHCTVNAEDTEGSNSVHGLASRES